ncbi:hypothetical protein VKT23_020094 [Stygiomarasmius scandens]|uniref:C2H2-type domain-containing protein n=1 Tax=Marasmiellus scandens TaxID=2682957 RepID=A0ABR1IJR9_9AGAR
MSNITIEPIISQHNSEIPTSSLFNPPNLPPSHPNSSVVDKPSFTQPTDAGTPQALNEPSESSQLSQPSPHTNVASPLPSNDGGSGSQWILDEYHNGRLTLSYLGPSKIVQITCPVCSSMVNSGIPEKGISPTMHNLSFLGPLIQHAGSSKCLKKLQRLQDPSSDLRSRSRSRSLTPSLPPLSIPSRARSESVSREMLPPSTSPVTPFNLRFRSPSLPRELPALHSLSSSSSLSSIPLPSDVQDIVMMSAAITGVDCPALPLVWNVPGSFNSTFPWARIGDGPGSLSFSVEIFGCPPARYARSNNCLRQAANSLGMHPCVECALLEPRIQELESIAIEGHPKMNYSFMNHDQLEATLRKTKKEFNDWKLKSLNAGRRLATAAKNLSEHKAFIMALADCDVPRLDALIGACLRSNASVRAMSLKLGQAMERLYSPKGFTSKDMDISLVIMRMGGRPLLHTCNYVLKVPSVTTLFKNMSFVRVMTSIGGIDKESVRWNINEVFLKNRQPDAPRRGMSIAIDETALNEQAVYYRHSNSVGGLCWLHTRPEDLVLHSYKTAEKLARRLQDNEVHFAKELTVAAITLFGESRIFPILLAGTCKQETAEDVEKQMETLIEFVVELVKKDVLWSIVTDGDPNRRPAGYNICMKYTLSYDDPLYPLLFRLTGLNIQVGKYNITLDFDYKHIHKRWSTNIRSPKGIVLNNGRVINRIILERFFIWNGMDRIKARSLLYPDDPQDVPRAIELLQAIIDLRNLRLEQIPPTTDIDGLSIVADLDAIRVLAEILDGLVRPFTDPSTSLQDQVQLLSKYAHLTFVMFRKYRTGFMSNQLYGDSQMMVKTAMFTIAKQQLLDPTVHVRLGDLGSDKLERKFGRMRMLGAHDSGMNEKQAGERSGQATDLDGVFERNPGWEPSPRRLNMTCSESVDHMQYAEWKGSLVASECDLELGWKDGRDDAKAALRTSQLSPGDYNFPTLFAVEGVDLSLPHGNGKYPGVERADILEDEAREDGIDVTKTTPTPSADTDTDNCHEVLRFEEEQEEPEELQLPTKPGVVREDFFSDNSGKPMHKATACRLVINKYYSAKSKDRQTRVFSNPRGRLLMNSSPEECIDDKFVVGNLFVTLFRTEKTVSICLARSTILKEGGAIRSEVSCASLKNAKQEIMVTGQILRLCPTYKAYIDSDSDTPETSAWASAPSEDSEDSQWAWFWDGSYHEISSAVKGIDGMLTDKEVLITVSSALAQPVNPHIFDAGAQQDALGLDDTDLQRFNSLHLSWAMKHDDLLVLMEDLWETFASTAKPTKTLPLVKNAPGMPYMLPDGSTPLLVQDGAMQLAQEHTTGTEVSRQCHCCGEWIKGANFWRAHIGTHILRSQRGVIEPDLKENVGTSMPCGYCARSDRPGCAVTLSIKAKVEKIESKCPFIVPISYKTAIKGSATTRCRNVPVICSLCPPQPNAKSLPAIWLYNMPQHLAESHPEYDSPNLVEHESNLKPLPYNLWKMIEVTAEEEVALGIPEEHRLPAFTGFASQLVENEASSPAGNAGKKRRAPNHSRASPSLSSTSATQPPPTKRSCTTGIRR